MEVNRFEDILNSILVISQILIPTDFSPASWRAMKMGMELASVNEACLDLLHVVPTVSRYSKDKRHQHLPEKLEEVQQRMDDLSKELTNGVPIPIQNHVLPGSVTETMLSFIMGISYDLVILGVNSHGADNEIGSHTSSIIEKCDVPVLVVPNNLRSNGAIAS